MILFKVNKSMTKKLNAFETEKLTVGLGEVTGHSHDVIALNKSKIKSYHNESLSMEDIANMDKLIFEITGKGGIILHEEHKPIYLESGFYLRINQLEYNPFLKILEKIKD